MFEVMEEEIDMLLEPQYGENVSEEVHKLLDGKGYLQKEHFFLRDKIRADLSKRNQLRLLRHMQSYMYMNMKQFSPLNFR